MRNGTGNGSSPTAMRPPSQTPGPSPGPGRGRYVALLVIDMQNGFCMPDGYFGRAGRDTRAARAIIPTVASLMATARAGGVPVLMLRYVLSGDYSDAGLLPELDPEVVHHGGLRAGSWDAQIVDELAPEPGDIVIDKTRYSAFHQTGLRDRLAELDVGSLVVCGVTTNVCVESTVRDAFAHDLHCTVVSDATAEPEPVRHAASLRAMESCCATVRPAFEAEIILRHSLRRSQRP
jgi:ureidoacrylate peracid hydrolase